MERERVSFIKNGQKYFLDSAKRNLQLTWIEFANKVRINEGTLKSYRNEYCAIPYSLFVKTCRLLSIPRRRCFKRYKAKKIIWSQNEIPCLKGYLFGRSRKKLKPPKITFTKTDLKLTIPKDIYSKGDLRHGIILPTKITPLLAEEVGIHLGDGFLSGRRHEFRLKGDKKTEREYYDKFIKFPYKNLYNADVKLKRYDTTYGFEITSKAIWSFKSEVLGIEPGPKDNIRIPPIFKVNDSKILCSLVRGFFDTDGSVCFQSRYGYKKYYPELSITSKSYGLIRDYSKILHMLGFNINIYKNRECWSLYLYGYDNLLKYQKVIGWHSPKHLRKVLKWNKQNKIVATVV